MIPNIRSVAARAVRTDAPLIGVSLAGVSKVFCRIIWAHLICGLDENTGMATTRIWSFIHLEDVDSLPLIAVFDRCPEIPLHEVCGSAFVTTAYRGRIDIAQNG